MKAEGLPLSVSEQADRSRQKRPPFHKQPEECPMLLAKVWLSCHCLCGGGWAREALLQLPSGFSWQEDFRAKGHRLN